MVPIVYDASYDRYFFGPSHPFSPIRQQMTLDLLRALGHHPPIINPPVARREDVLSVHSAEYVDQVQAASAGTPQPDALTFGLGSPDVPLFDGMDLAARILAGGTLHGARMIVDGEADVVLQLGGGLHHAQRGEASGFCIYNDLSIAIRHFREMGWRVAYLDIDVHHGDGVQALHASDREVMTISLHESGHYLYPGSGFTHEIGDGDGRGFSLNVPLEPGTTDDSYIAAFERVVPHSLTWFQPDVMVIQCGVDAHFRDPLADLLLTSRAYERLFSMIIDLVGRFAGGRALFTLGGGYEIDVAPRLWTMLYLMLIGERLPDRLPAEYLDRWNGRAGGSLTPTLHDPDVAIAPPDLKSIENRNRSVSRRVLELVAQHWY